MGQISVKIPGQFSTQINIQRHTYLRHTSRRSHSRLSSVGMPPSIKRGSAGARTTPASQDRQAYFGRRVNKYTELGRDDIQTFADILTNDVTFRAAATGDIGRNDLFDAGDARAGRRALWVTLPRLPFWEDQSASSSAWNSWPWRRFDVFQRKMELVRAALLSDFAPKSARLKSASNFSRRRTPSSLRSMIPLLSVRVAFCEPILGLCRNQKGFERVNIIRKISGRSHAFDLSKSGLIGPCKTRPEYDSAAAGGRVSKAVTRRQSRPANKLQIAQRPAVKHRL